MTSRIQQGASYLSIIAVVRMRSSIQSVIATLPSCLFPFRDVSIHGYRLLMCFHLPKTIGRDKSLIVT